MISTIIICPGCGQRFDPTIERGEFRSARGTKLKPRVGAQDVRTAGHRGGPHHELFVATTRAIGDGWAPIASTAESLNPPLLRAAQRERATLYSKEVRANGRTSSLWFVAAQELEGVAVECGGDAVEWAQRVLVACEIVRGGAPWWHAWLQAHGVPGETIAQGYRVGRARRADVWLGHSQPEAQGWSSTLPGLP